MILYSNMILALPFVETRGFEQFFREDQKLVQDLIERAVGLGLLEPNSEIGENETWALNFFLGIVENESLHDRFPDPEKISSAKSEISHLNDLLDLEECDKVENGKSFSRVGSEIKIPDSLAPFMADVVLPALRKIVEKGS